MKMKFGYIIMTIKKIYDPIYRKMLLFCVTVLAWRCGKYKS